MEVLIGILVFLVLAPCLGDLRIFVKNTLKDINGEQTTKK